MHEEEKCQNEGQCSDSQSCGCGQSNCNCGSGCGCNEKGCAEPDMLDSLMYLAHHAKMKLLKEKIKHKLEAVEGKKLDKIADILVEGLLETKKNELEGEKKMQELRERLDEVLEQK